MVEDFSTDFDTFVLRVFLFSGVAILIPIYRGINQWLFTQKGSRKNDDVSKLFFS